MSGFFLCACALWQKGVTGIAEAVFGWRVLPCLRFLGRCNFWKGCVLLIIVVYGEPVPQGRPRFANGHAYDPQRSKNYKQLVRFWVTQFLKKIDGWKPHENALCVDLTFYVGIPTSWSQKKRIQAINGQIRPITRSGDLDNLIKAILDANNGLLWVDDCIITDISARKRYTAELARVEIKITEVQNAE